MTRVIYSDCTSTSPDGRFTLEALSPSNGQIPEPDDKTVMGFRYQLLDTATRRVCWERWGGRGENPPFEVLVSNDGWSILRTHGFAPELIAVSPDGRDTLCVRVHPIADNLPLAPHYPARPYTPTFDWRAHGARQTTAGTFWTRHSWPYFLRHAGQTLFVWRTAWDERLILLLEPAALLLESELQGSPLAAALNEEEKRLVRERLQSLQSKLGNTRYLHSFGSVEFVSLAFHLAAVHSLTDCIPLLQPWERTDRQIGVDGSTAFSDGTSIQAHALRPILYHSLRLLGEVPTPLPPYFFTDRQGGLVPASERVEDRAARASAIASSMPARQVLELMGSPDFLSREYDPSPRGQRWEETWEFDFHLPTGWQTLTLTWVPASKQGRIQKLDQGPSPWLQSPYRARSILQSV